MIEIYPVFFLVPIMYRLLTKEKLRKVFQLLLVFSATIVLGTLPFYFFNPSNFLTNYLIQFSRVPNAVSLWEVIAENSPNWELLSIFNLLTLSPLGITFLAWFVVYAVFCLAYFRKFKEASKREEFLMI